MTIYRCVKTPRLRFSLVLPLGTNCVYACSASSTQTDVVCNGTPLLRLVYAPAATWQRINRGWRANETSRRI
jgi:hypothetical protein